MKIIKTFIRIIHIRYIFLYHERKKKTTRNILRAMLGPARRATDYVWAEENICRAVSARSDVPQCLGGMTRDGMKHEKVVPGPSPTSTRAPASPQPFSPAARRPQRVRPYRERDQKKKKK